MDDLKRLGEALGGPEWVQGPGGNVSVKEGEMLYVKASGKRLRDMGFPGAYAEVPIPDALLALAGDAAADQRTFSRAPRPSLETYFHAIGATVVAHTHAIGALLVACSSAQRPEGVLHVPYERPGRSLGVLVQKALSNAREGAVLLESHGLIVYAETVDAAVERSFALDRACRVAFPGLGSFADLVNAPYSASVLEGGGVFTRLPKRKVEKARYLTPDSVVFASVSRVRSLEVPEILAKEALAAFGRPVVLVADDGSRVQCARNADELGQAREVALAHDFVEDALASRGDARYLPDDEPPKIVGMPSEQYRLALTRSDSPC
jgi:ribulose-5-phosphate 4-epimerase/fuculose-1-phosphate aldolase